MSDIRVLVADDRTITRHGLVATLREYPDFEVVGEAADVADTVRKTEMLRPNVIIVNGAAERTEPNELMRALSRTFGNGIPAVLILVDAPEARFFRAQHEGAGAAAQTVQHRPPVHGDPHDGGRLFPLPGLGVRPCGIR